MAERIAQIADTEEQQKQQARRRQVEDNLITRVSDAYDSANSVRLNKLNTIQDSRKAYNSEWVEMNFSEDEAKKWFYVPKTFEQCQAILSELLSIYMRLERFSEVKPTIPWGEDQIAAEMMDNLLYIFWDRKSDPYEVLRPIFEAGIRDGTSVGKCSWERVDAPGPNGRGVPIRNEGVSEYIPIENALWDPVAKKTRDIRWFIHEQDVVVSELWSLQSQGVYENVDKVQGQIDQVRRSDYRSTRDDEIPSGIDPESGTVRVREYWGELQTMPQSMLEQARQQGQNNPVQNIVCTVSESGVLLRPPEPNPYARLRPNMTPYEKLPFFLFRPIPKDDSTWGRSIPEILKGSQREINKLRNQRRQEVDLGMGLKIILNEDAGTINEEQLMSPTFAGIVKAQGNLDEILKIFQPQGITRETAAEENLVDQEVAKLTGVTNEFASGVAQSKRQTRGEVESLLSRSSSRLATMAEAFNETGVTPMLNFYVSCIVNYVEPEEVAELLDFQTVPPPLSQILDRDYEVSVRAGLKARAKNLKVQDLEYALQTSGQVLQPFPKIQAQVGLEILAELLPYLGAEGAVKGIKQAQEAIENAPMEGAQPQGQGQGGQSGQ